jgi:hypothetical protein
MGLEIGQRVGEYEILALLGAGGMGQVYSAGSAVSPLSRFFAVEASQKSAAPVTEAPAPSLPSGGGTAGATSTPRPRPLLLLLLQESQPYQNGGSLPQRGEPLSQRKKVFPLETFLDR